MGATQCADNLAVSEGVFTATIDFGQQFATTEPRFLQIEVRTDTGLGCGNLAGFVTLAPRQPINPAPAASHAHAAFSLDAPDGSPANAVYVANDGRVGIGTIAPGGWLDIQAANNSNVLFGRRTGGGLSHNLFIEGNGDGGMQILDASGTPRIQFRSGNNTFFNYGNVAIGSTANTAARLWVETPSGHAIIAGGGATGIFGDGDATGVHGRGITGPAVRGENIGLSSAVGVRGEVVVSEPNSFGVFSLGRLGATGTKSFRIDHPDDPHNRYLFHYCAESPEVINFYRGTVTLDNQGMTVVQLPPYFGKINTDPSYQLTAVGAPMPMLHVSVKINERALAAGAAAAPGRAAPACWFAIACGVPGGEVSWRVEAVRNDEFVREGGAPVEVVKPPNERGARPMAP